MSEIVVRGLATRDVAALTRRAERSGWPLEAEIRRIIVDAAREERAWQGLVQASETMDRQLERTESALRTRGARRRYRTHSDRLDA